MTGRERAGKQRAEKENWEFWEFDVERQVLEERFQFWLPRFTAYSVVTLLYTVVEVQLAACGKVACLDGKPQFAPTDMRGRGIEAAVLYLEKVDAFDVKRDTAWLYRPRVLGQWFDGNHVYAAASSPPRSRRTWAGLR